METRSFLMGYFYAGFIAQKRITNYFPNSTEINLKSGEVIKIDINRGICPSMGNVAWAYVNTNKSLFCIPQCWVSKDVWEYLMKWYKDNGDNEVRIDFDSLVQLIDFYGGLG